MKKRSAKYAEGRSPNPAEYIEMWSTPAAADAVGSHGGGQGRSLRTDIYNWKHGLWPTPKANSGKGACIHGQGGIDLQTAVTVWPTPLASDGEKGNLNRDKYLSGAVRKYPTPTSSMMTLQDMEQARFSGTDKRRPEYGKTWPTPTSRDYKDGSAASCKNVPVNGLLGRAVHTGSGARGQLSADWVGALMGYPGGWTDIDKEAGYENDYPEKWLDGTWEDGIPRVAVKQARRVQRLKCLGNAIVPQCAEVIFMLPVFDRWRRGEE